MKNNPAAFGFADALLDTVFDYEKFLPFELCPTKFYDITFEGWEFTLEASDESFNKLLNICVATLKEVKKQHEEKFIFAHPNLYVEGNGRVGIRVGMMEKERYKETLKRKKDDKDE